MNQSRIPAMFIATAILILIVSALSNSSVLATELPLGETGSVANQTGPSSESANYRLTAEVLAEGGGTADSASYQLAGSIGSAVEPGVASSANFKLVSGPIPVLYPRGPQPNTNTIVAPPQTVAASVTVQGTTAANASVLVRVNGTNYATTAAADGSYEVADVPVVMGANVIESISSDVYGDVATASVVVIRSIYNPTGTLESRIHDGGEAARWTTISWQADTPTGTSIAFRTRTGDTAVPDTTWSVWSEPYHASGAAITSPDGRYIQYEATFQTNDGTVTPALHDVTLAYETGPAQVTFDIPLTVGWNLVSIPLHLDDPSIATVLTPIAGKYELVNAYDGCDTADHWKAYNPSAPPFANDLTEIDEATGFWIKVTEAATLSLTGSVPTETSIGLCDGWNLVGYPTLVSKTPAEALVSINGCYDIVWAYKASDTADSWKVYNPVAPPFANDLQELESGLGYWIDANQACTWNVQGQTAP